MVCCRLFGKGRVFECLELAIPIRLMENVGSVRVKSCAEVLPAGARAAHLYRSMGLGWKKAKCRHSQRAV